MSDTIKILETSLQEMASAASVPFNIWNRHSNAVLALILDNDNLKSQISDLVEDAQSKEALISELVGALEGLRNEISDTEEHGDGADDDGCSICLAIRRSDAALTKARERSNG